MLRSTAIFFLTAVYMNELPVSASTNVVAPFAAEGYIYSRLCQRSKRPALVREAVRLKDAFGVPLVKDAIARENLSAIKAALETTLCFLSENITDLPKKLKTLLDQANAELLSRASSASSPPCASSSSASTPCSSACVYESILIIIYLLL